jgi:hypothetical protein
MLQDCCIFVIKMSKKVTNKVKIISAVIAFVLLIGVVLLILALTGNLCSTQSVITAKDWPLVNRSPIDDRVIKGSREFEWQAQSHDSSLSASQKDVTKMTPVVLPRNTTSNNTIMYQNKFGNCFDIGGDIPQSVTKSSNPLLFLQSQRKEPYTVREGFSVWNSTHEKCYIGVVPRHFHVLDAEDSRNVKSIPEYKNDPQTFCDQQYARLLNDQTKTNENDQRYSQEVLIKKATNSQTAADGYPSKFVYIPIQQVVKSSDADLIAQDMEILRSTNNSADQTLLGYCSAGLTRPGQRRSEQEVLTLDGLPLENKRLPTRYASNPF